MLSSQARAKYTAEIFNIKLSVIPTPKLVSFLSVDLNEANMSDSWVRKTEDFEVDVIKIQAVISSSRYLMTLPHWNRPTIGHAVKASQSVKQF